VVPPSLSWTRSDLKKYDAVIVGLTPPTSIAANNIYGALHVLDIMYESPKLRVVTDGAQVWQYKNSIESYKRNPGQVLSSMYSNRREYSEALGRLSMLESVADKMSNLPMPISYSPMLPWGSVEKLSESLGFIHTDRVVGINLDYLLISREEAQPHKKTQWAVQDIKSDWWQELSHLTKYSGISTSLKNRVNDSYAYGIMKDSIGVAIPPQGRKVGTWWSYGYVQALNANTPVVTKWQDSWDIGSPWSVLAYQIEDMDAYDRQNLASMQYESYMSNIPSEAETRTLIEEDLIRFTKESV
jgi:hypothetical protein